MDPKAFKALQAKWYKKLKQSGFVDIENPRDPNGLLLNPITRVTQKVKLDLIRGVDADGCSYAFSPTQQFYERRQEFLLAHKFRTKGDRLVFEGSVGGLQPAEIWRIMKGTGNYREWGYWRVRYSLEKSNKAYQEWLRGR